MQVNDTSTPTKCGLMKQLMLSLSVQLINTTEVGEHIQFVCYFNHFIGKYDN